MIVIAVFITAIHVFPVFEAKTWMPGTSSAKTRGACHRAAPCADPLALLPGHDEGGALALLIAHLCIPAARHSPEWMIADPRKQRAQGMPGTFARTHSLACNIEKVTSIVATGTAMIRQFPAQWF